MALTANNQGQVTGKFTIPKGIPAGSKAVQFTGKGGSRGVATFIGQGNLQTTTLRSVTTTTVSYYRYDPLAQTFTLEEDLQLAGADLWFTAKGSTGVTLQIRETSNGYPTPTILVEQKVPSSEIIVSGGGHSRILFERPVALTAGVEYALVVLCDDAITALAVAELGKFDSKNQQWVTAQAYTVGTLLSSSNASTWTAHQDKDMTFRLLAANYSSLSREVDLGRAEVLQATDVMLMSVAEIPSAKTRVEYALTMPSGETLTVSEGQPVRLASPISGQVEIKAKLAGIGKASPVLWPGSQLVSGSVELSADYVSRAVPAVGGNRAVLIYDAKIPSGATVTPYLRQDQGEFQVMSADGHQIGDDGFVEYIFKTADIVADTVQVKLVLTGTVLNRPLVSNIRVLVV